MIHTEHPNYCPLFFKGMYVWANGLEATVGHCCLSGSSSLMPQPNFYHASLEHTRHTWAEQRRSGCKQCWDTEQRGFSSMRQHHITWLKDAAVDPVTTELLRLDFAVGTLCNAKCIMCNSNSSSAWAAEDFKFGVKQHRHNQKPVPDIDQITNLDVSKLRQLYITGGEPMMSQRPVELLNHIKQNGTLSELEFSLNTNGSILPDTELRELLAQCKQVDFWFSIDGTGREFEYIRNPLKWAEVDANIRTVKSLGVNVNIAVAVGVHNIDIMPDIYKWCQSLDLPAAALGINRCWGALDVDFASEALRTVWRKKLQLIDEPWVSTVQSMIAAPGGKIDFKWEKWLSAIDQRRNFNWRDELPLLADAKNKADAASL